MKMMNKIKTRAKITGVMLSAFVVYFFIAMSALFWFDWLWVFGVEDSQQYTWWGMIYAIANGRMVT